MKSYLVEVRFPVYGKSSEYREHHLFSLPNACPTCSKRVPLDKPQKTPSIHRVPYENLVNATVLRI